MKRSWLFILIVAVGSMAVRGDDDAPEVARRLQGKWQAVEIELAGVKAEPDDVKAFRLAVKGDEMTLMTCKGDRCIERKKQIKVDPAKVPMQLDLLALDGQEKGSAQPCIFSLDGDRLRLCAPLFDASKRPTGFKTQPKDGFMSVVLERVLAD